MSNLTVSYVSQTPAATPAAGSAPAAPADGNPLGFLGALLDQLLAAGTNTVDAGATGDAVVTVPGLIDATLEAKAEAPANDLLASLVARLDQVSGGGNPAGLKETIDDILASTDATAALASSADAATLADRLSAIAQSVTATDPGFAAKLDTLAGKLDGSAADPDAQTIADIIRALLGHRDTPDDDDPVDAAANPAPQTQSDLLQILTTLGLNGGASTTMPTPAGDVDASASVSATAAVPRPLVRLSTQLSEAAKALASSAPELSKKIEAVATRLVSADADASLSAKLTSAAVQSDGTALDKLVQNLLDAKPVTTPTPPPAAAPQIAAPQELPVPAPIAPQKSKSAIAEVKAAPPEPAPATADSAPKPAQNVTLAAAAQEPARDPKPEAKAEAKASAILADTAKADPAAPQASAQPQQAPVAAQQARPLPAAYQPVANPINMGQLAFEMVRQVHQGTSRFTIRLDPPELGRVDVKMHVDNTGTVNARLTVDRAETLDLFQRDRQSLERALAQAGLDAGKTNLEFSLRQNNHNPFAGMMGGDGRQPNSGYGNASRFAVAGNDDEGLAPAVTLYRGTASAGGINIFA